MDYLLAIFDTPAKLDLLQDVRLLLPATHVPIFDSLAPYHKMANPPTGFEKHVRIYFVQNIVIGVKNALCIIRCPR